MVAAKPDTPPCLETVLTVRASRDDIRALWPLMEPVGELASPGPALVATVELSSGQKASVVFHQRGHFLEILVPLEAGVEVGLAGLLIELGIRPEAVTWTHGRIDRRALFEATVAIVPTPSP